MMRQWPRSSDSRRRVRWSVSVLPTSKTRITGSSAKTSEPARTRRQRGQLRRRAARRSRSIPCTTPATGSTHARPRARSRAANAASSSSVERARCATPLGECAGTTRVEHLETRDAVAKPTACASLGGARTLMPKPIATHSGELSAPARLDEDARELPRRRHRDRSATSAGPAPRPARRARGGDARPHAQREHVERARVGRPLDEREPDACAARRTCHARP